MDGKIKNGGHFLLLKKYTLENYKLMSEWVGHWECGLAGDSRNLVSTTCYPNLLARSTLVRQSLNGSVLWIFTEEKHGYNIIEVVYGP